MPYSPDNPRHALIMKLATGLTAGLLLLPLFVSWRFNLSHDGVWFLRAALFVVLAQILVWRLCLHIRESWVRIGVAVALVEGMAIFAAGRLVSFYYQGESYNQEFFFHFNLDTLRFALGAFPGLVGLFLAYLVLTAIGAYFSIFRTQVLPLGNRTLLIVPVLLVILGADPDISAWATAGMRDANTRGELELSTIDWEATGLKREALYKTTDDIVAGKNVVMIYLESVEQMYTDQVLFPGLTPFLNSLEDQALVLDNLHQTRGTNFTVAGILSSQCGTPLLFPSGPGGNDILKNGFLQEGNCVGDILNAAGYQQVFMGGASTRFAGKGIFLTAHGYNEVLGLEELIPLTENRDYINSWGLYDDTLLTLAADKFDALAASDQPFNFTVLTVDTHPPDGTVSESCSPYPRIDNNIFHAVHCTDQLLEKFINHLKQSPAWEDTVVMIMSDHLHMRNTAMDYYPLDYDRKLYVSFLNAGRTGTIDTNGTHMDIAPTVLSLMGVEHQQQFLAGNDLLSPDGGTHVDTEDYRRIAAIRYLNTNLLSKIDTGLCEADLLYSMTENPAAQSSLQFDEVNGSALLPWTLRVAGREVDLSMRGRPLALNALGTNIGLLSLVSREGKVGLTFPVSLNHLAYVLYQFRDSSFLLFTPSAPLQRVLPGLDSYPGMGVVFGNVDGEVEVLAEGLSMQDPFDVQADCGDLLDKARDYTGEGFEENLGKICNNTVPSGNVFSESQGNITLESVSYGTQRFNAVLTRNDRGWYAVTGLREIAPVAPVGSCDAYYANMEILIPGIQTPDGPASMILDKVPGVTLTFELGPIAPLPQSQ